MGRRRSVATANRATGRAARRGWTVFDATDGSVVWDAGNSFEEIATRYGLHNEDRADSKGPEPEGLAYDVIDGTPYAFVGSERSNFVAVYDMTDPTDPEFRQVLPATNGPEGLLPIPSRNLLVVSSEEDDASVAVRASVGVYELGDATSGFPTVVSADDAAGHAIGWGALGALSGVPGRPHTMYAASDAAYATGRIYSLDTSAVPAVIDDVLEVTDPAGETPALDIEGLAARPGGGFWLAVEGATGPGNQLVRADAAGVIRKTVALPDDVTAHIRNWGLEGVTVTGSGRSEQVYVAVQRPLWVDPSVAAGAVEPLEGNVARIGRYDVADDSWTWFSYELESTAVSGDWLGLSEIVAVDDNTLAVIERDKLNGPRAAVKRVYTVDLPARTTGDLTPLTKKLAFDLLPEMQAEHGWTQEKLEGLGVSSAGRVFAVTDNDGLTDATGETQLYRLGPVTSVFDATTRTSTTLTRPSKAVVRSGGKVRLVATVRPGFADGRVRFSDGKRVVRTVRLDDGRAILTLHAGKKGKHVYRATFLGDLTAQGSTSGRVTVVVRPKR